MKKKEIIKYGIQVLIAILTAIGTTIGITFCMSMMLFIGGEKNRDVRVKGLEPSRLSSPDPKSGAAANYATPACVVENRAQR